MNFNEELINQNGSQLNQVPAFLNGFDFFRDLMQIRNIEGDDSITQTEDREILDVNELEKDKVQPIAAFNQEEQAFLSSLRLQIERMTDELILMAESKIDKMEDAIELNIREKILSKIRSEMLEKERTIVKQAFESEMFDKEEFKSQMILSIEKEFQEYFVKVAGVYDIGLKHFKEYCQEAKTISEANKAKNQLIHDEINALRSEERNTIKELQNQTKEEQEEIKAMKDISDTVQKCIQKISTIKERNSILEIYLNRLKQQLYQQELVNQTIVEKLVKENLTAMIEEDGGESENNNQDEFEHNEIEEAENSGSDTEDNHGSFKSYF